MHASIQRVALLGPVDPAFAKAVVWVYPNILAARKGEGSGGTGFLVSVPLGRDCKSVVGSLYIATCRHVLLDEKKRPYPAPAIVIKRRDGEIVPVAMPQKQWTKHGQDDLAIGDLDQGAISTFEHDVFALSVCDFVREGDVIPIGSEAMYIGRFQPTNKHTLTVARFGNISASVPIPVPNERLGIDQLSFLLEARTRTGFSGSPAVSFTKVPLIVNAGSRPGPQPGTATLSGNVILVDGPPKVLGMVWGFWEETQRFTVKSKRDKVGGGFELTSEASAGMVGVVPAWRIVELLESPKMKADREQSEAEYRRKNKPAAAPRIRPAGLSDQVPSDEPPGLTRTTFLRDLRKIKKEPKERS